MCVGECMELGEPFLQVSAQVSHVRNGIFQGPVLCYIQSFMAVLRKSALSLFPVTLLERQQPLDIIYPLGLAHGSLLIPVHIFF